MSVTERNEPRPLVPALRRICVPLAPFAYAFIRVCAGLIIARHGYPKLFEGGATGLAAGSILPKLGFTPPIVWAYIIGCTEFFGGLMLAVGFLTRLAAAALIVEFAVIVFAVKWANGFFAFAPKAIQPGFAGLVPGGFEFEMLLGLICVAAFFRGSDALSVDRAIGREL
ncbi:MAG TPA: DoxX family protein [Stellaceae bacterium]|nr:DoxX family protein [Stellaceae bacterium]